MKYILNISALAILTFTFGCGKQTETTSEPTPPATEETPSNNTPNLEKMAENVTKEIETKAKEAMDGLKNQAGEKIAVLKKELEKQGDALIKSFGGEDKSTQQLVTSLVTQALNGSENEAIQKLKGLYQMGSALLTKENLSSLNNFRDALAKLALTRYFGDQASPELTALVGKATSMLSGSGEDSQVLSILNQVGKLSGLSGDQSNLVNNLINVYQPSQLDEAKNAVKGLTKGLGF